MRTEKEIWEELKKTRYERVKKEPYLGRIFMDGYWHALRWILEKSESVFEERNRFGEQRRKRLRREKSRDTEKSKQNQKN